MKMYHGGSIKSKHEGYKSSKKKGSFEFGVGLYTCNNYMRCTHYSRSIKEIELVLNDDRRSDNVYLDIDSVLKFIYINCSKKVYKKAQYDFEYKKELSAARLQTYLVNNTRIHLISDALNTFFVENEIDYTIEDSGNLILVHNFDIIKSIKKPEF